MQTASVCQRGMCLPHCKPTCLTKQPLLSNTPVFLGVLALPRGAEEQRPAGFETLP